MQFCVALTTRVSAERSRADGSRWINKARSYRQTASSCVADKNASVSGEVAARPWVTPRKSDIAGLTISPDFAKPGRKPKASEESAPARNGRSENEPRISRVLALTGR